MESEDLGYEFHDNFVPVGLSAGDAAASSAIDESIALVESMLYTLNRFIIDTDAFSEANKSDFETRYNGAEGSAARIGDKDHKKR